MPLTTEGLDVVNPVTANAGASPGEPFSAEVRDICDRLGIHDLVKTALRLIEKHFRPDKIHFEPTHDPEEDNEWLAIRAEVRGSVDEVLKKDDACSREWVTLVPPANLGLVRIVFDIQ